MELITASNTPTIPLIQKITIDSQPSYDSADTVYLAHGVVAFQRKEDQPNSAFQIMTIYMDTNIKKIYVDQAYIVNNVLAFMGRSELDILSYDKESKIITLSGDGWDKIIIDTEKKKVLEATDSNGDVVYLKSSWDINK